MSTPIIKIKIIKNPVIRVKAVQKPVVKAKMLSQWPARVAVGVVTTGEPGTSATVENVGTAGSAVLNFTIPRGAKGDMGPQGQKGDQGEQGPQGIQGPKGDPGDIGATGPAGAQGPQGIKGDAGSTGAQGPKGDKGDKGDTGDTGPEGPAGPKGDQGPAGAGTGDMLAATYDPNGKATDAFNQDNMVDGTTNKNYTAAEKSKLAGVEAGAQVNPANATTGAAGLMSATDKSKLDGVASGATANVGTVTSVGLSAPTGLSVSGSPVTVSGSLTLAWSAGYQGYTTTEASKLSGIAAGAEVNLAVGTTSGTVAAGDDSRITGAVQKAGNQTITGGFSVTPNSLGTVSSFTLNPALGNYQYGTNNGAFTLTAPASDCAVDLLVTNGSSAGSITFSGFTVGSSTGDALTTTNGHKFIISIRRINSVSTYIIKALQ